MPRLNWAVGLVLVLLVVKVLLAATTAVLYALGTKDVIPASHLKAGPFYGALFLSGALYVLAVVAIVREAGFWWPLALAPNLLALLSFGKHWPTEIGKVNVVLTVVLLVLLALPWTWRHSFQGGERPDRSAPAAAAGADGYGAL